MNICVSVSVSVCVSVIIKTQSNGSRPVGWLLPSARCGSPSKMTPAIPLRYAAEENRTAKDTMEVVLTHAFHLLPTLSNKQAFFPFPILSLS